MSELSQRVVTGENGQSPCSLRTKITCSGSSTAGDWLGCLSLAAALLAAMGVSGAEEGSEEEAAEPRPMKVTGELAKPLESVAPFSRGIT